MEGNWLFIDMESLGITQDSAVLSIGCLYVTEQLKKASEDVLYSNGLYLTMDVESQCRKIDKSTLEYWSSQPKEFKQAFSGKKHTINEAYVEIAKYLKGKLQKEDTVWSRGLIDKFFYESLFASKPTIIPHYMWRDSITALDILTGKSIGSIRPEYFKKKHNALYNCVMEYKRMREALSLYE